ncbi:hypothetical protein ACFW6V_12315 [Streptomyces sp. NPDC058734]|uniref:hypothetical protein n=1 Tax=Streptomyces sp. NPDC058734 TaxID=3346615 RepID=UPI003685848C
MTIVARLLVGRLPALRAVPRVRRRYGFGRFRHSGRIRLVHRVADVGRYRLARAVVAALGDPGAQLGQGGPAGAKTTVADCATAFTSTSSTPGRRPSTAATVFC